MKMFRGQASLEAFILMAGTLAFFLALFSVILPVQEKVKNEALERLHRAAFERISFELRIARRLGEGTRLSEKVYVPSPANVSLNDRFSYSFGNTTWEEPVIGRKNVAGTLHGTTTVRVENAKGLAIAWD